MKKRIAVIGAGIIGISSAYKILSDHENVEVTVYYDVSSPDTTGDLSASFIYPYKAGEDVEQTTTWFRDTFHHLAALYRRPDALQLGVSPISGFIWHDSVSPAMAAVDSIMTKLGRTEHKPFLSFDCPRAVFHFTTWTCDCRRYLPWLSSAISRLGGKFVKRRIHNLDELSHYDVIVNCSGIGAKQLVRDDPDPVFPIRGQVFTVVAPWIKHFYLFDEFYILPRLDDVVVGGTAQKDDWNTEVDEEDGRRMWEACCKHVPSLSQATILNQKVGLRPARVRARLELVTKGTDGSKCDVIHNYGHGGAGVTVHWGCASDVSKLVGRLVATPKL